MKTGLTMCLQFEGRPIIVYLRQPLDTIREPDGLFDNTGVIRIIFVRAMSRVVGAGTSTEDQHVENNV